MSALFHTLDWITVCLIPWSEKASALFQGLGVCLILSDQFCFPFLTVVGLKHPECPFHDFDKDTQRASSVMFVSYQPVGKVSNLKKKDT